MAIINLDWYQIIFIISDCYSINMRIKTVPRHRIFQNRIKIASATESPSDEESADVEKDYELTDAIDSQESNQVNINSYYLTFVL